MPRCQNRQHRRVVLGITGRIGAGKTSVGNIWRVSTGSSTCGTARCCPSGGAQRRAARLELQAVGWAGMLGSLQPGLNRELISRIEPGKDCAVDGLRHPVDYAVEEHFYFRFFLSLVDCPAQVRWEHLEGRGRYKTRQDFDAADAHPVEQHIDELRPKAFAIIENTGSRADLFVAVNGVLERIRSGDQP